MSDYIKKIKIGNIELNNNILLAPMAGITDRAFRIVCEEFEPGLVCTEMISSKGLFYGDKKELYQIPFLQILQFSYPSS